MYYYSFENTRNLVKCIQIPESSQGEIVYLNNTHGNNNIIRILSFLTSIRIYRVYYTYTIISTENCKNINKKTHSEVMQYLHLRCSHGLRITILHTECLFYSKTIMSQYKIPTLIL